MGQSRTPRGWGPGEWDGNQNGAGGQGWCRRDGRWGRAGVRKGQGCRMGVGCWWEGNGGWEMVIGQKRRCRSLGGGVGVGVGLETGLGNPGPVGSGGKGGHRCGRQARGQGGSRAGAGRGRGQAGSGADISSQTVLQRGGGDRWGGRLCPWAGYPSPSAPPALGLQRKAHRYLNFDFILFYFPAS